MNSILLPLAASFLLISCASEEQFQQAETRASADSQNSGGTPVQTANSADDSAAKPATAASPAQTEDDSVPFVHGLDVSKYQGDLVGALSKSDSLTFIICKATEGLTFTDPDFGYNWKTITEKGLIRGAYHFYHSNDDPVKQAEFFWNAIKDLGSNDLPPILDIEAGSLSGKVNAADLQKQLLQFLGYIEQKSGRTPMIYTAPSFANSYLSGSSFSKYPLWLAEYTGKASPDVPKAWKSKGWTMWQKSSTYKIDTRTSDFDIFNGNRAALMKFITAD